MEPFLPRGLDHETLRTTAIESAVQLALLGGVGSNTGGATQSSSATFVTSAKRKPEAVALAEILAEERRKAAMVPSVDDEGESDQSSMVVAKTSLIYEDAVMNYPLSLGKSVSFRERIETKQMEDKSLVYSELDFVSVLKIVEAKYGGVLEGVGGEFFDLGSGTGKNLLIASCVHAFDYICGVEVLEGLYNTSFEVTSIWHDKYIKQLPSELSANNTKIEVKLGDCRDLSVCDWTSGDVVLCNCICFTDELMDSICVLADGMKVGAFFVTVTRELCNVNFEFLESMVCDLSWGSATVFVQRRVSVGGKG